MSRAPHAPTPELRSKVRSLAAVGLPQDDIAEIVGCAPKTLRLHYRQELDEGSVEANAIVVDALLAQIKRGNTTAMIFFEKCRGGKKETIKEEVTRIRPPPSIIVTPRCERSTCQDNLEREFRRGLDFANTVEGRRRNIQRIRNVIDKIKANPETHIRPQF